MNTRRDDMLRTEAFSFELLNGHGVHGGDGLVHQGLEVLLRDIVHSGLLLLQAGNFEEVGTALETTLARGAGLVGSIHDLLLSLIDLALSL